MHLPGITANANEAIAAIPQEVWDNLNEQRPAAVTFINPVQQRVSPIMIIPLIIVIISAIKGLPTLACLFLEIISSLIFGLFAGTITSLSVFLDSILTGFSDAESWVIVMMMWVGAFGKIICKINAFAPLSNLIAKISRNVRQLMFYNGVLSF
jgi:Na+/H+ antiporter NhaC